MENPLKDIPTAEFINLMRGYEYLDEGNPGAIIAITRILLHQGYRRLGPETLIMIIDKALDLRGYLIYNLWGKYCQADSNYFELLLYNFIKDNISKEQLINISKDPKINRIKLKSFEELENK